MTKVFKEPGSGLIMELGKWYVLGDSGAYYHAHGFDSVEFATEWWMTSGYITYELPSPNNIAVPAFNESIPGWDNNWDCVNVLKADDLLKFWQTNDPEIDLHYTELLSGDVAEICKFQQFLRDSMRLPKEKLHDKYKDYLGL